jgi:hypothetical protein
MPFCLNILFVFSVSIKNCRLVRTLPGESTVVSKELKCSQRGSASQFSNFSAFSLMYPILSSLVPSPVYKFKNISGTELMSFGKFCTIAGRHISFFSSSFFHSIVPFLLGFFFLEGPVLYVPTLASHQTQIS